MNDFYMFQQKLAQEKQGFLSALGTLNLTKGNK